MELNKTVAGIVITLDVVDGIEKGPQKVAVDIVYVICELSGTVVRSLITATGNGAVVGKLEVIFRGTEPGRLSGPRMSGD